MGQFLATRADIFGAEFADDLAHLRDRLEPFPTKVARAEVERSLGRPIEALFAGFGEPVAAASLAQAHEARLLDGRKVAVKVLRPGVELQVARDSAALRLAADMVEAMVPPARRLEPRLFVETVIRALDLELDLRFEAAGADELREVMARDAFMAAPAIVWDGVAKRVLTQEWAGGRPLSDPTTLDDPAFDRPALANNLTRAFLAQALDHGVFHADPARGEPVRQPAGGPDRHRLRHRRAPGPHGAAVPGRNPLRLPDARLPAGGRHPFRGRLRARPPRPRRLRPGPAGGG